MRDSSTKVDTCARLRLGLLGSGACATEGAEAPAGAACGAAACPPTNGFGLAAPGRTLSCSVQHALTAQCWNAAVSHNVVCVNSGVLPRYGASCGRGCHPCPAHRRGLTAQRRQQRKAGNEELGSQHALPPYGPLDSWLPPKYSIAHAGGYGVDTIQASCLQPARGPLGPTSIVQSVFCVTWPLMT